MKLAFECCWMCSNKSALFAQRLTVTSFFSLFLRSGFFILVINPKKSGKKRISQFIKLSNASFHFSVPLHFSKFLKLLKKNVSESLFFKSRSPFHPHHHTDNISFLLLSSSPYFIFKEISTRCKISKCWFSLLSNKAFPPNAKENISVWQVGGSPSLHNVFSVRTSPNPSNPISNIALWLHCSAFSDIFQHWIFIRATLT